MEQNTIAATESDLPKQIGDYEVQKFIGKGKFAVVYRAKKIGTENSVALKRISVDLMDEKTREKCLKEVRLLQNLDHKNIIRYLDSFILENDLIIVFEWAAAGDLKRQLRKAIERGNGFDERTIWKYFSQICDAMQHMHVRRIMHRDLKPANIFLTLDGTIKVGDLGLSREMSEHTIQAHSKVGTPLYMSPEVLNGEGYDFKTDIWSLGCLLYELAALKSPFKQEGMNIYALCQKIASGDFQPLPDTYSEELRSLVYSMISTKPEDRPEIGAVCEIARRLRAETQDKKSRKSSTASTISSDAAIAVATVTASMADPIKTTEFDIKPPTANLPQTTQPAQWDLEFDTKPTTAASASRNLNDRLGTTTDDNEQTDNWEDKWNRNKRSTGSEKTKRSGAKQEFGSRDSNDDPPYQPSGVSTRTAGIASQQRLRSSDPKPSDRVQGRDDEDKGTRQPRSYDVVDASNFSKKSTIAPAIWSNNNSKNKQGAKAGDDEEDDNDNFVSVPIKPVYELNNGGSAHATAQVATSVAANVAPTRRLKSSEDTRGGGGGSATGTRPNSQQRPESKERVSSKNNNGTSSVPTSQSRVSSASTKNNNTNNANGNGKTKKNYFPPPQSNPNKFKENFFIEAAPAFALMEELYSKLILLNYSPYEDGFDDDDDDDASNDDVFAPVKSGKTNNNNNKHTKSVSKHRAGPSAAFLPIHFACDLQVYDVAGRKTNQQFFQFKRMVCVAVWLSRMLNNRGIDDVIKSMDSSLDVPLTSAKQVIRLAQIAIGLFPNVTTIISSQDLSNIVASTLTCGYGYNVCCVLNVLVDCVIASGRLVIRPCVYDVNSTFNSSVGASGSNAEGDDIEEDPELGGVDRLRRLLSEDEADIEDDNHDQQEISDVYQSSFASGGGNTVVGSMLFGAPIDPLAWKEETERVGRALATHQAMANTNLLGATEWSSHIQLIKNYADMTSSSSASTNSTAGVKQDNRRSILISELVTSISQLKSSLDGNLLQIRTAEGYLNNKHSMSALTYTSIKKEHSDLETRLTQLHGVIEKYSNELSVIEENKEIIDSELQTKLDSQGGSGSGGSGVIVKLNEALLNMKKEIKQFHMTISVLNASLNSIRLQEQVENREAVRLKAKTRVKSKRIN